MGGRIIRKAELLWRLFPMILPTMILPTKAVRPAGPQRMKMKSPPPYGGGYGFCGRRRNTALPGCQDGRRLAH
jgi:hypothetical protein